jgi:hypothetical protein
VAADKVKAIKDRLDLHDKMAAAKHWPSMKEAAKAKHVVKRAADVAKVRSARVSDCKYLNFKLILTN